MPEKSRVQWYSTANIVVLLDSTELKGLADSDNAVMIGELTLAEVNIGSDGNMTAGSTGRQGRQVQLTYQATSPGREFLTTQQELQRSQGEKKIWSGSISVPDIGLVFTLRDGIMEGDSGFGFGSTIPQDVTFTFTFREIVVGSSIATTASST